MLRRLQLVSDAIGPHKLAPVSPPVADTHPTGYGGPKHLERAGRDAGEAGLHSSAQAGAADRHFQAVSADADAGAPRWTTVEPGGRLQYEHALAGRTDGGLLDSCALPVMVVAGTKPGPTILLIAGEHGNECEPTASMKTGAIALALTSRAVWLRRRVDRGTAEPDAPARALGGGRPRGRRDHHFARRVLR